MFIPSYQIHNILKDFTQQLKKMRQQGKKKGPTADAPGPGRAPDNLRLASVVNKVADNIMDRIAALGREADPTAASDANQTALDAAPDSKQHPPVFDYHLMDRKNGKVRQRLVVEDSRHLVERFQDITSVEDHRREEDA
jgi:hypothetical protein